MYKNKRHKTIRILLKKKRKKCLSSLKKQTFSSNFLKFLEEEVTSTLGARSIFPSELLHSTVSPQNLVVILFLPRSKVSNLITPGYEVQNLYLHTFEIVGQSTRTNSKANFLKPNFLKPNHL
ncbi:hypothetical protein YC2023_098646 [Brassica napus]